MKVVTLPLDTGTSVTIFVGAGNIAVTESTKNPKHCRVCDGIHNNGGWPVALTRAATVQRIIDALAC